MLDKDVEQLKESMESKVIDLGAAKAKFKMQKKEDAFKRYLSALKRDELQFEANHLINSGNNSVSPGLLRKSAMLMDELAKRVDAQDMSSTIQGYAQGLREKLGRQN